MRCRPGYRSGDPAHDEVTPDDGILHGPSAQQVTDALSRGLLPSDRCFDRFLPRELRLVSGEHWTPLAVAARVAEWLDDLGLETVVDLGSGAGKFCVATALSCGCEFTGIEQRPRLVEVARRLAETFRVDDRVRFVEGTLGKVLIPDADAYYLFNPFGENLFGPDRHLDDEVELGGERYRRDITLMEDFLERASVGIYVIKYNGFGGAMPASYEPIYVDREMPNVLRLWQKTRSGGGGEVRL